MCRGWGGEGERSRRRRCRRRETGLEGAEGDRVAKKKNGEKKNRIIILIIKTTVSGKDRLKNIFTSAGEG